MQTLFDPDAAPLSEEEMAAVLQSAGESARAWKSRALYCTAAFFLSCASVVLFWRYSFDGYLIILSTGLLLPLVLCAAMAIQMWIDLRNLRRTGHWLP
jgi:hypothetical protein